MARVGDGADFPDARARLIPFRGGLKVRKVIKMRKVGSGMGLALAARLVARLGGSIQADHAPEGGAKFTVALPL